MPLVFQDWYLDLPMQQQSVLVLACRGPDGVGKFHPTKQITTRYRATVLKAAYLGRAMDVDEGDETTFMTLVGFGHYETWHAMVKQYFEHVDELPHHYHMHLMHGAEIIAYHHPIPVFQERWWHFYNWACIDLHLREHWANS